MTMAIRQSDRLSELQYTVSTRRLLRSTVALRSQRKRA